MKVSDNTVDHNHKYHTLADEDHLKADEYDQSREQHNHHHHHPSLSSHHVHSELNHDHQRTSITS